MWWGKEHTQRANVWCSCGECFSHVGLHTPDIEFYSFQLVHRDTWAAPWLTRQLQCSKARSCNWQYVFCGWSCTTDSSCGLFRRVGKKKIGLFYIFEHAQALDDYAILGSTSVCSWVGWNYPQTQTPKPGDRLWKEEKWKEEKGKLIDTHQHNHALHSPLHITYVSKQCLSIVWS